MRLAKRHVLAATELGAMLAIVTGVVFVWWPAALIVAGSAGMIIVWGWSES